MTAPRASRERPAPRAQWVGIFLAPAVFFAHLQTSYLLVPWACASNGGVWIKVVGALAMLLTALGAVVAWRVWERTGRTEPGNDGGALPRTRFVAVVGLGASVMFTLLLFAQWVAGFFISPCQ
jgi:hypothetical protein